MNRVGKVKLNEEIIQLEEMWTKHLSYESSIMDIQMRNFAFLGVPSHGKNRKKNRKDSIAYRERGNFLFCQKVHSSEKHEEILKLYNQSIALAPNDSEELAFAFGNRSALLLHLKKYKDCINDCNLAIEVSASEILKAKLLTRKVQCLAALDDPKTNEVYNEILQLISEMNLDSSIKEHLLNKLSTIKNDISKQLSYEVLPKLDKVYNIPTFIPGKEAPCASEAVTIEYNKEWGRHIVATRDIQPGEIIILEKIYYAFIYPDKMWVYCQNCSKLSWSSIPCKGCIFGIYCSKECRQEAWDKYHKFECEVFPHVWDIDEDIKCPTSILRLLLIAIHELGDIKQLKEEVIAVHRNQDQRTKGFSDDGVFHSYKFRSFFSLASSRDSLDMYTRLQMVGNAAEVFYYFATCTDFFGKKLPKNPMSLLLSDDAKFISSLMARLYYLLPGNTSELIVHYEDLVAEGLGLSIAPFGSLINHSCDPNVITMKTKNEELLAYAKYPIKKGEQIFRAYLKVEFLEMTKNMRQAKLLDIAYFECKCLPCVEDWSIIGLPYLKDMLENDFATLSKIFKKSKGIKRIVKDILCKHSKYSPKLMAELVKVLSCYAKYASVHCQDYDSFAEYMFRIYNRSFGSWHKIPDC